MKEEATSLFPRLSSLVSCLSPLVSRLSVSRLASRPLASRLLSLTTLPLVISQRSLQELLHIEVRRRWAHCRDEGKPVPQPPFPFSHPNTLQGQGETLAGHARYLVQRPLGEPPSLTRLPPPQASVDKVKFGPPGAQGPLVPPIVPPRSASSVDSRLLLPPPSSLLPPPSPSLFLAILTRSTRGVGH